MHGIKLVTAVGNPADTLFAAFVADEGGVSLTKTETIGSLAKDRPVDITEEHPPYPVPLVSAKGKRPGFIAVFHPDRVKYASGPEAVKTAVADACRMARRLKVGRLVLLLDGRGGGDAAPGAAEGALLGSYAFTAFKGKPPREPQCRVELLLNPKAGRSARQRVADAMVVASGTNAARDLVNTPPSVLTPSALARVARSLAAKHRTLSCRVMNAAALRKAGHTGTVAVGRASAAPPCMIVLRHKPPRAMRGVRVALVGKAVTFDTGGICVKPPRDMWRMKGDMAGGAAVVAAMEAIAALGLPVEVLGIVPAACNAINGNAVLPGDIIRAANGRTVQIDNTDAEGRLLLMDALIEAARLKATLAVDIATLTGAAAGALGPHMAALFSEDDGLAADITAAGARAGELFWRLPMHREYIEMMKCDAADLTNSSGKPTAGAITAALFLREFVEPSMRWAHLDIAGTYMMERPWRYLGSGGTGFGVRTFVELVRGLARKD